jgi:hypothetical protein
MAEENLICPSCQAVMRQRALFCYKCGASIVSNSSAKVKKGGRKKTSELIAQALKKEEISNVWFQDKIVEEKPLEEKIEEQPEEQNPQEIAEDVKIETTPSIQEKAKLASAASMRQKAKTIQKKQIEVVWEQPESSNVWFILGTIIFSAIALGAVFLAWTLR